jgi:hypothetical protein
MMSFTYTQEICNQFFMCLCPCLFYPKLTMFPFQNISTSETTQACDTIWNVGGINSIFCTGYIRLSVRLGYNLPHTYMFTSYLILFYFGSTVFEFRASFLLGRCSNSWATPPALFWVKNFQDGVSSTLCLTCLEIFLTQGFTTNCHQVPTAVLCLYLLVYLVNSSP